MNISKETNDYIKSVIEKVREKNSHEKEFIQTVTEVFESIAPVIENNKDYIKDNILERIAEPERGISFRVPWVDKDGNVQVNKGYRYQFNSAIGPYKGGLRFHPSVYSGIVKFLGFEQIFKNSLTSLPLGGGKGGSDFNPKGKTDQEILNFTKSFMTELYRHIGPNVDVPAGDIGVGGREIGYLFGQYKRIKGSFENGTITGKGLEYGGSLIRPEATGYGVIYFTEAVLNHDNESLKGKTIALSGYGNVAWGTAKKATELGAKVLTISGSKGYIYDKDGISTDEKHDFMIKIRSSNDLSLKDYADKFNAEFHPNEKPWKVKADIVIPAATQNEIDIEEAKKIKENGTKYLIEAANMPLTNEAIEYLQENNVIVGPAKAANAGGVAVSGIEMMQNSLRDSYTAKEVDEKLKGIMNNIFKSSVEASEKYNLGYDLVKGANIAGFEKVAKAMKMQGKY